MNLRYDNLIPIKPDPNRKEQISIKLKENAPEVIEKIQAEEKHALEVIPGKGNRGWYTIVTDFTLANKPDLMLFIAKLKNTYPLEEAYHDEPSGILRKNVQREREDNPYANLPPVYGMTSDSRRPYSERSPVYKGKIFDAKPVIPTPKEKIIIKPLTDDSSILDKIKLEKNVLEIKDLDYGYYSVLTPFTLAEKSKLDELIQHLKNTNLLEEVYHSERVGIVKWLPT